MKEEVENNLENLRVDLLINYQTGRTQLVKLTTYLDFTLAEKRVLNIFYTSYLKPNVYRTDSLEVIVIE